METSIRSPMDLGDIVSAAWSLYVRRWRTLVPMALLSAVGLLLTSLALTAVYQSKPGATPAVPGPRLPLSLGWLMFPGVLLLFFNQLVLDRYSLEAWLTDHASVLRSYLVALRVFAPTLVVLLITGVLFVPSWLEPLFVIELPFAIYFAVCWFFTGQVFLAEGSPSPWAVMRRGRMIVRGSWWRTAGILLAIALLSFLPVLVAGILPVRTTGSALVVSSLASALAAPFSAAAQTMLYLDLRLRKHESIALAPRGVAEPL